MHPNQQRSDKKRPSKKLPKANPPGVYYTDQEKRLGAQPHQLMQERLINMNPLQFGETIRLPIL